MTHLCPKPSIFSALYSMIMDASSTAKLRASMHANSFCLVIIGIAKAPVLFITQQSRLVNIANISADLPRESPVPHAMSQ